MKDPFLEHERLSQTPIEDESVRIMKQKAVFYHQSYSREKEDEVVFLKKKRNLELKIKTWQAVKEAKMVRCDEGHMHLTFREDPLYLETLEIPWDKAKKFARWILDQEIEE